MSWELHHDRTFPLGDVDNLTATFNSDPTCDPQLRSTGCNSCDIGACTPRPCEFNQVCPNATDKTTAARLGGLRLGALASHMVRFLAEGCVCDTFLKVMQFGQFVAHSFSMTAQKGDFTELKNQIR